MSIYQKASLVQIPSGYKAADDKLYSVVPNNGDGDFTVSVDADATRVNKDGLIESVAADQARLNYDPTNPQDPHLLLEPSRENLITYSELFDNSYWTKENSSIGTGIVSPMGDTDAQNVIEDTTTGRHRIRALGSVSSGTSYSLSVWAKSTNRNLVINADALFNARSGFNLSTGVVADTTSGTATITAFPNDWFLCTVTGAATSTQTQVFYLQMQTGTTDANYTGDGSSTLSLFGAQLEAGSYPTSYIPTSGIAETRTQDDFENSFTGLTSTAATIFLDFETKGLDSNFSRLFAVHDSVTSDGIYLGIYSTNTIGFFGIDGGSGLPDVKDTISFNQRNKIVLTFDGSGNYKYSLNGSLQTGTYTGTSRQYDEIGRGNVIGGSSNNIVINQIMVFNEALTDGELQTLTS